MCENWKAEYTNHILDGNSRLATSIKNRNINRNFYKYRCFDDKEYWVDWIKGTVFAVSPNTFNDPFDCLMNIPPETSRKQLNISLIKFLKMNNIKLKKLDYNRLKLSDDPIEAALTIIRQRGISVNTNINYVEKLEKYYKENRPDSFLRKILKVACFSEKNDSLLMWSHYTYHHQGFCIEYDFSECDDISNLLFPVVYSLKKFTLLPHYLENNEFIVPAMLCKSSEWSYEQEWRYIYPTDPAFESDLEKPKELPASKAIKAIYLGAEAIKHNNESVNKLMQIIKDSNMDIVIYEMKFDDHEYKLISNPVNF